MEDVDIIKELKNEYTQSQLGTLLKNINILKKYSPRFSIPECEAIASKFNISIEKSREINQLEANTINHYRATNQLHYDQYLYKFNKKQLNSINIILNSLCEKYAILRTRYIKLSSTRIMRLTLINDEKMMSIKDICDKDADEQTNTLKDHICAELRKEYDPISNNILSLKAFKIADDLYIGSFSIYNHRELLHGTLDFMKTLLQISESEIKFAVYNTSKPAATNNVQQKKYWSSVLLPLPQVISIPGEEHISNEHTTDTCSFNIGNELSDIIRNRINTSMIDSRSIFLTAWGLFFSHYNSINKVILAMAQNTDSLGSKLEAIPIALNKSGGINDIISSVNTQVKNYSLFDKCLPENLSEYTGINSDEYFSMLHQFIEIPEIDELVCSDSLNDKIVCLGKHCELNNKLFISYQLYHSNISINYTYNTDFFHVANIESLHNTYMTLLQGLVKNIFKTVDFVPASNEIKQSYNKAILAQKILYLKSSGLFNDTDITELSAIADKLTIRSCQIDELLLNTDEVSDKLFIIGEGKIEVSTIARDGYEKVIQILKSDNIFGIEAIISEPSHYTYSICSSKAKLLTLEQSFLTSYIKAHPDFLRIILKIQSDNLYKFQKLWLSQ